MHAPLIETSRTYLRPFTAADAAGLHAVLGDAEVMRYSLTGALTLAQTEARIADYCRDYARDGFGFWALRLRASDALIGVCGVKPLPVNGEREIELGYRLARDYWRQGLATESARAVCAYAFAELKLPYLIAAIEARNTASLRVAGKLGFEFWKPWRYEGIPVDLYRRDRASTDSA